MKLFYTFLFCFPFVIFGQDFKKFEDNTQNKTLIRYYNTDAHIIVQKTIYHTIDSVKYEIGLLVYRSSVKSDDFMFEDVQVIFDDNTVMIFHDQVVSQFIISGKYTYSVKHLLTKEEYDTFCTKRVNNFRIYQYKNKLDKWQKEEVMNAFNKIINEY